MGNFDLDNKNKTWSCVFNSSAPGSVTVTAGDDLYLTAQMTVHQSAVITILVR